MYTGGGKYKYRKCGGDSGGYLTTTMELRPFKLHCFTERTVEFWDVDAIGHSSNHSHLIVVGRLKACSPHSERTNSICWKEVKTK